MPPREGRSINSPFGPTPSPAQHAPEQGHRPSADFPNHHSHDVARGVRSLHVTMKVLVQRSFRAGQGGTSGSGQAGAKNMLVTNEKMVTRPTRRATFFKSCGIIGAPQSRFACVQRAIKGFQRNMSCRHVMSCHVRGGGAVCLSACVCSAAVLFGNPSSVVTLCWLKE